MSNGGSARRRLSPAQTRVAQLLGPLDGARIPGGCDSCATPEQAIEPVSPGIWMNHIHHDDWCAVLAAHQQQQA